MKVLQILKHNLQHANAIPVCRPGPEIRCCFIQSSGHGPLMFFTRPVPASLNLSNVRNRRSLWLNETIYVITNAGSH